VILVLAALGAGVAVGLATGGSLRNLADIHFRWPYLAIAGLLLQWMPVPHGWTHAAGVGVGLLLASYVLLLTFVLANIRRPGMVVVAIGLLLNGIVIAANAGMPVTAAAVRSASGSSSFAAEVHKLDAEGGAKHRLAKPDDKAMWLSDRFGIGKPIEGVFSIGDLFWLIGGAWVVAGLMRGPRRTSDSHAPAVGEPVIALPDSAPPQAPVAPVQPPRHPPKPA
jgi:Family of unknown function (DUF5317)